MPTAVANTPIMDLLSNIPGRQRWRVPAIDSRPRLAAAVEIAIRRESGVLLVQGQSGQRKNPDQVGSEPETTGDPIDHPQGS